MHLRDMRSERSTERPSAAAQIAHDERVIKQGQQGQQIRPRPEELGTQIIPLRTGGGEERLRHGATSGEHSVHPRRVLQRHRRAHKGFPHQAPQGEHRRVEVRMPAIPPAGTLRPRRYPP